MIDREDQLLPLLARGRMTPEARHRATEILRTGVSWPRLLRQARTQEVTPLVHRNLRALDPVDVAEEVRAELATACRSNAVRNAILAREQTAVLTLLAAAGIPAIPLKGPALAQSLYGDVTSRVCRDIDILVPRASAEAAVQILLERGFAGNCRHPFWEKLAVRHRIEMTFVRETPAFQYVLELHWGLFVRTRLEDVAMADLWSEARRTTCLGAPACAMSPEWELLFLAVHAARHQWLGLKWIADIHEACSRSSIDWERLKSTAARLEWQNILGCSLAVSHALYGTDSPAGVRSDRLPSWVQTFPADAVYSGPGHTAFILRLLERPAQKLGYLIRALLTPAEADLRALTLPSRLRFFYYAFRPVRLSAKWGWRAISTAATGSQGVSAIPSTPPASKS